MLKNALLAAAAACLFFASPAAAEVVLTVDSVLNRTAVYNYDVLAARSNYEAVSRGIDVAESAKLPTVNASLDLTYIGDGTVLDRDFTNAMRDKLPHFGNTLKVSVYQPVYAGGAINAGIELAHRQAALAAVGVAQQADASGIEAVAAYFNLMKMHNLRSVYAGNIELTQRLIDNMKVRHSNGVALKNDVTRYELRLSSLTYDLQTVDNSISILNKNLALLTGLDPEVRILPADSVAIPDETLTEEYWQQMTAVRSVDLLAVDKQRMLAETGLKLEKAARMPTVGLIAADQLSGPVTFEIPALNKNYNSWFLGVSVNYNISSLWTVPRRERQKKAEIAHISDSRCALSDALERRVHDAFVSLTQARQMLLTENENVRLANENYQLVETRFTNNMALLTDMLDASVAKLDAEIRLVNARINILLAFYQLKYISGTLYN